MSCVCDIVTKYIKCEPQYNQIQTSGALIRALNFAKALTAKKSCPLYALFFLSLLLFLPSFQLFPSLLRTKLAYVILTLLKSQRATQGTGSPACFALFVLFKHF